LSLHILNFKRVFKSFNQSLKFWKKRKSLCTTFSSSPWNQTKEEKNSSARSVRGLENEISNPSPRGKKSLHVRFS